MDKAQRIRIILMIEKIEKNPEFRSKNGVRNTSEFILQILLERYAYSEISGTFILI